VHLKELISRIKGKSLLGFMIAESGQPQSEPQREVLLKSQQEAS
jgi:hypothetical protein